MYPIVRMMTLLGLISIAAGSVTGCGEKRMHVATLSGSPGNPAGLDEAQPEGATGLNALSDGMVSESDLDAGQAGASGVSASRTDSDFADSSAPDPDDAAFNAFAGAGETAEDADSLQTLPEGSSLHARSGYLSQDTSAPASDFEDLPQTSFDEFGADGEFTTPQTDSALFNGNDSSMEEIPGAVQVAKAEPSDMIHEQLEQMKTQELAATIAGLEDVFFEFDSWTLTAEGKDTLERNMQRIQHNPATLLLIEGHADQRGTQAYNMVLAKKRAASIRDYLYELGIDHSRLSIIAYGKDKPFCKDPTEVCHQLNRRGHLLIQ